MSINEYFCPTQILQVKVCFCHNFSYFLNFLCSFIICLKSAEVPTTKELQKTDLQGGSES